MKILLNWTSDIVIDFSGFASEIFPISAKSGRFS
jgi:hypothetical protein